MLFNIEDCNDYFGDGDFVFEELLSDVVKAYLKDFWGSYRNDNCDDCSQRERAYIAALNIARIVNDRPSKEPLCWAELCELRKDLAVLTSILDETEAAFKG
jgi:hypothetical protein